MGKVAGTARDFLAPSPATSPGTDSSGGPSGQPGKGGRSPLPQLRVVEVAPDEIVIVGGAKLLRANLHDCRFEGRDARCQHRFVRHLWIQPSPPAARIDLTTDPRRGAIAPRAARMPEVLEPTAILRPEYLAGLLGWLEGGRRLLGQSLDDLARLSCVASVSFAIEIGERAADLAEQMTWERGSPMRSSPVTDAARLLKPFERLAQESERANLALMAALSLLGKARSRADAARRAK